MCSAATACRASKRRVAGVRRSLSNEVGSAKLVSMVSEESRRRRQVDVGVFWSEATMLQIERVRAVNAELAGLHQSRPWENADWEVGYMKPWYKLEADRDFLILAANHLVRAVEFLHPPSAEDTTALDPIRALGSIVKTLRDCVEHWDEREVDWMSRPPTPRSGQAYRQLAQISPDADMQSYQWSLTGEGARVAGVLDLGALSEAANAARSYFQTLGRSSYVWDGWR